MSRISSLFKSFSREQQEQDPSKMSKADEARRIIAEISEANIDEWVRAKTFTAEVEESVRGHIHEELTSWMFFRKLGADCARSNISLPGFSMYWQRRAEQCLIDMHWLEKYLVSRGGCSKPTSIEAPRIEWPDSPVDPVHPCREALCIEKKIFEDLERLASLALRNSDVSLGHAIQTRFMRKQSRHVKDAADLLQQVVRVSKVPGLGLYVLDCGIQNAKGHLPWTHQNDPDVHHKAVHNLTAEIRKGLDISEEA